MHIIRPDVPQVQPTKAQPTSPYVARLTWPAVTNAHYYNVYCGDDDRFAPSQSTLIGSPDRPELIDWGLKPGRRLYYRIAGVDRFGNEGPASAVVPIDMPAIQPITIEKDFAELLAFDAPAQGTYAVFLRLRKPARAGGSYIDVKVDGKAGGSWVGTMDGLADEPWLTYDQWGRFDLAPGRHTLQISNKTAATIDRVFITNDLSRTPPGHLNIPTGW